MSSEPTPPSPPAEPSATAAEPAAQRPVTLPSVRPPSVTLSPVAPADADVDVIVLAVAAGRSGSAPRLLGAQPLPEALRSRLEGSLEALGVSGAADEVRRLPGGEGVAAPVVALVGTGPGPRGVAVGTARASDTTGASTTADGGDPAGAPDGHPAPEVLRRAAGAATRSLAGTGRVAFAFPARDVADVAAIAEGALLGAYTYRAYRARTAAIVKDPVRDVTVLTGLAGQAGAEDAVRRAAVLGAAVAGTRDLVNTPPADLYPAAFAEAAEAAVQDLPVTVTVLDEQELRQGGYGGLTAVGMGSSRPPRLVRLDYRPEAAATHLALVGKGITFDSGGLSIKPAAAMETMKSDMSGAAAVLHTILAAARLELPVRISGWLALAENMPSGSAVRPSDVITTYGGRTVEVLNTDAEGRLVLADAIAAAGETGPDLIVDVATLTGAQVVALGNRVSAVMANTDDLRDRVHRLADAAGEQFWPMPLPPELRPSLDSPVADLANMGDRFGGMLVAGLFLAEFVPERGRPDAATGAAAAGEGAQGAPAPEATGAAAAEAGTAIPWAHLDIAGPSFNTGAAHGYTPVGGTGVAVRTLLALAEDVAANGA